MVFTIYIYNRGVEKRDIFLDHDDYLYFLHILKSSLSAEPNKGPTLVGRRTWAQKNYFGKIDLLAYCLMPNHFHFLVRQSTSTIITEFVRSLCTRYGMYFNKKYDRVGPLFQGIFKAIDIDNESYLLWICRYIHRNPTNFKNHSYNSYQEYLGARNTPWINTKIISDYFSVDELKKKQNFIEFTENDSDQTSIDLENLSLEADIEKTSSWRP
ncbi:MAG: transposase [Patescibacteria group bacterium]